MITDLSTSWFRESRGKWSQEIASGGWLGTCLCYSVSPSFLTLMSGHHSAFVSGLKSSRWSIKTSFWLDDIYRRRGENSEWVKSAGIIRSWWMRGIINLDAGNNVYPAPISPRGAGGWWPTGCPKKSVISGTTPRTGLGRGLEIKDGWFLENSGNFQSK